MFRVWLLGRGMRKGERAHYLIAVYSVVSLVSVVSIAAAQRTPQLRAAPPCLNCSPEAQQAVTDALQSQRALEHEKRLSRLEERLDTSRADARLIVLESAVEYLTWSARTNYVVAITLVLNFLSTLYQARAEKHRRGGSHPS